MRDSETAVHKAPSPRSLNDAQERRLNVTCEYIDKLLCDIEQILHEASSPSPFPRHVIDINPAQGRVLEGHIRRLREQLVRTLAWQGMSPEPSEIPATRAVLTHLSFIDIAIEELRPGYMRGSGSLSEGASAELSGISHELRAITQNMERYLRQNPENNIEARLGILESGGRDVSLLRLIEQITTRHGLVEFRSRISLLASRLEDNELQVAMFGRVSCGKSSLLNAVMNNTVLPVGVNPITAVPTRIRFGERMRARITFASGVEQAVSLEVFQSLITEKGNPNNSRNVLRAEIELPSPRLREGVVLVDTPGLGSLARRGAAETMAYLPACDLALLMIDASGTVNEEDVNTLRILHENEIPTVVLISKSDLLAEGDLTSMTQYIEERIHHELQLDIRAHPVSALPGNKVLIDYFFERELLPRFAQAKLLRATSVARKIGVLQQSVGIALETRRYRNRRNRSKVDSEHMENVLRSVAAHIGELQSKLDKGFFDVTEAPGKIVVEVARLAAARISEGSGNVSRFELTEWTYDAVQRRIDRVIEEARTIVNDAANSLWQLGVERFDRPDREEVDRLFTEAPRIEIEMISESGELNSMRWLGSKIVFLLARRKLDKHLLPTLSDQLHRYGLALRLWAEQVTRRAQTLLDSYAETYRAQITRANYGQPADMPAETIDQDLRSLENWRAAQTA